MFQKDMNISLLLDFYGEVLKERRREIMDMYYNEDLSLSEIADITDISRQGVRDSIKKSERELLDLEETLGLSERFQTLKSEIGDIESDIDSLIERLPDEFKPELDIIKRRLEKLDI